MQPADRFGGQKIKEILLTRGSPRVQSQRRETVRLKKQEAFERPKIPTLRDIAADPTRKANDSVQKRTDRSRRSLMTPPPREGAR